MYMFLPFLIALISALGIMFGKKGVGYGFWLLLLVVSVAWFNFHATDALTLSF
jgi:xanthosine utilization system XapX-like protein